MAWRKWLTFGLLLLSRPMTRCVPLPVLAALRALTRTSWSAVGIRMWGEWFMRLTSLPSSVSNFEECYTSGTWSCERPRGRAAEECNELASFHRDDPTQG